MASSTATQQFVPIEHIRDGIITMKNGELRAVIITNSLNLSLKSEEEQEAVLMQFQSLLNSLEFPIQFFIQSRKLNIKPYKYKHDFIYNLYTDFNALIFSINSSFVI